MNCGEYSTLHASTSSKSDLAMRRVLYTCSRLHVYLHMYVLYIYRQRLPVMYIPSSIPTSTMLNYPVLCNVAKLMHPPKLAE